MSQVKDWNKGVIEEFRANAGKVGGPMEGRPLLLHHRGAKTGVQIRENKRRNPWTLPCRCRARSGRVGSAEG
jgi:hypothetical protein